MAAGRKRKKIKLGGHLRIFLVVGVTAGIVFLPTSLVLLFGLLPTFVLLFVDRSAAKTKAFTVGAMNLAGCSPFLMELWGQGHNIENAISVILDPMAIIVMYAAAAVGYIIDKVVTGIVASFLYQRGLSRRRAISALQKDLVERWGAGVTGEIPLDSQGFPLDSKDVDVLSDENRETDGEDEEAQEPQPKNKIT